MRKLVALDSETLDLPDDSWNQLAGFGELIRYPFTPKDPAVVIERCAGADIVLSNKVLLMRDVLEKLTDLKMICVLATGMNNVDLDAASEFGIEVRNVPAYSTQSVAQNA